MRSITISWNERRYFIFFKKLFIFKEEGKEKEGEEHHCVIASCTPPTGDMAHIQACALTGIEPATSCFAGWHSIH